MKYFEITVDQNYVAPMPAGWNFILDRRTLASKKYYEFPNNLLFRVEKHMQMVFTDIITFPCFMVSKMVKDVIGKYDPLIKYVRIILLDREREVSKSYYVPFLDKSESQILQIKQNRDKTAVIMRMDLVESILRRGAAGIGLKETEYPQKGDL